jgi:hypothetical protein
LLLKPLRLEFEAATWRAFRTSVLEGKRAAELDIPANIVHIARSRVLSRLRQGTTAFSVDAILSLKRRHRGAPFPLRERIYLLGRTIPCQF